MSGIGPSEGMLKELVKKKKIKSIKTKTKVKFNPDEEDTTDNSDDENEEEQPSLLKKKKMTAKRKSIFSKGM